MARSMTLNALVAESQQLMAELTGLRDILASAGSYVCSKDLKSRYTYVNAVTCELFGLPFDDIVCHDDSKFFPPDIVAAFQENDRLVQSWSNTGSTGEIGSASHRRDATLRCRQSADAQRAGADCRDLWCLDGRHRAKACRGSHRLLDTVLKNVEANIYMKDAEGRYLYANRNVLETVQLTQEPMIGHRDSDLFQADIARAYKAIDDRVFATGQPQRAEEPFVDAAGRK
jgi:PAS domain-containing protein